jgi:hypothetical protein
MSRADLLRKTVFVLSSADRYHYSSPQRELRQSVTIAKASTGPRLLPRFSMRGSKEISTFSAISFRFPKDWN